ncbi:class I SAM-dependent DNA methyltransferase [Streptomyces zagrosensis]|uniref:SAM-dependent methyltransferase n=1 Tax=Streptomyces zagrosensis TaxID=1042984 RepID=A0A7W9QBB8_9ACTN|nr:class I SAM-dependent methyltransferase [Streptomyces zagrosensis]MBB5937075.1 SAM-dependent methyltransferase [Streptomyces zagrosensis]
MSDDASETDEADQVGVDHPILRRMYSLSGDVEERTGIYDDWARDYERDTANLGYVGPALAAARVAELVPPDTEVLDAACGTGLVGVELAQREFTAVDGVDLSSGMLDVARQKGIYRHLAIADITRPLPAHQGGYGAVVCAGTFTAGHVGPEGIDSLVAAARPGGYTVLTVLSHIWDARGFPAHIAELTQRGAARLVDQRAGQTYHTKEPLTCWVVVLQTP